MYCCFLFISLENTILLKNIGYFTFLNTKMTWTCCMWTIISTMKDHSEWFQETHLCFSHNWPGSSQLSLSTIDNFHWWAAKFPYRAITIDLTQPGPQPSIARGDQRGGERGGAGGCTAAWLNLNFLWLLLFWVRSPLIPVPNQRVKRAPGLIHHVAFVKRTTWEVTDDLKTSVLGILTPPGFWTDKKINPPSTTSTWLLPNHTFLFHPSRNVHHQTFLIGCMDTFE